MILKLNLFDFLFWLFKNTLECCEASLILCCCTKINRMKMFFKVYVLFSCFVLKLTNSIDLSVKLKDSLQDILQFSVQNDHYMDINILFGTAIVSGNNFCNYEVSNCFVWII